MNAYWNANLIEKWGKENGLGFHEIEIGIMDYYKITFIDFLLFKYASIIEYGELYIQYLPFFKFDIKFSIYNDWIYKTSVIFLLFKSARLQ